MYKGSLKPSSHQELNQDEDENFESFNEWLRNKHRPANDHVTDRFIESINLDSVIDKLNKNDRNKAFDRIKAKLQEVIGDLAMTERLKINYRINDVWRSRTLTREIWNQLMDSFDKEEFIYGKEILDTNLVHFSNDAEEGVFKLIHFGAISFTRIKPSGSKRKDNRDSFFPYLNTSDLDLTHYQIIDSIVARKGGRQRKELKDSCFVYALNYYI